MIRDMILERFYVMEISLKLPNNLYQNVAALAHSKKKSVAIIITNAVRKAVIEDSTEFAEQAKILEQSIKFCSDYEVLELLSCRPLKISDWATYLKRIEKAS